MDESYTLFVSKKDAQSIIGEATIEVESLCLSVHLGMFCLIILWLDIDLLVLQAPTVYGALRGLEVPTFSFQYSTRSCVYTVEDCWEGVLG